MIGTWMFYSIVVTGLVAIAGHFAESACLLARRSTRTVWILVLLGAVAIPIFAVYRPNVGDLVASGANPGSSISGPEMQPRALPAAVQDFQTSRSAGLLSRVTAILAPFDTVLLGAWAVLSCLWLIVVLVSATRVRRGTASWKDSILDGVRVRVSDDIGPALAGIFTYRIVVPGWVAGLSPEERAFVLEHEREHARAHDPALIAMSAFFIVLVPWNAVLWYVQKRLRMAIELDCDMRVLRKLPDVKGYGSLLINVGERNLSRLAPLAAFAEPRSSLKKRIEVMASASPSRPIVRTAAYLAAASVLFAAACRAPKPTTSISPADRVRSLGGELAALPPSDSTLVTNVISPELYQSMNSIPAARHASESNLEQLLDQIDFATSRVRFSRQFDSGTRTLKSLSDSIARQTSDIVSRMSSMRTHSDSLARSMAGMPSYVDTLRLLAKRLEPAAFDTVTMPSSVAVGLIFGAHGLVVGHSLTSIAAAGDLHAGYDTDTGPSYTIGGGVMKRLFPNVDAKREIQALTVAYVAGKKGGRQVVVIALRTNR